MRLLGAVQQGFLYRRTSLASKLHICGVFSEAAYFKSSTDEMFLIHDIRYGLLPFGIAIPEAKRFLEQYNIKADMELTWQENVLYFPEAKVFIVVSETEESISDGCIPNNDAMRRTVICGTDILRKCGKGCAKEILCVGKSEEITNIYMKKAFLPLKRLEKGMEDEDAPEINGALLSLLGLGPGLTPSMDDFLTAVLFTCLFVARHRKIEIPGIKILAAQIMQWARERTGEFSAAYLTAAAEGGSFSLLEDLICAEESVELCCEKLLAVGGNTGADQLAGVIWSLQYILKQYEVIHM